MLDNVLLILAGLTGLGGFISILVNLLKMTGVIKPGTSDKWYGGINLVAFIAVSVVYFINKPVDWGVIDDWLRVFTALIGLVLQMFGGQVTYQVLKGAPLVGYSFDEEEEISLEDLAFYKTLAKTIVEYIEQCPAFAEFTSEEKKQRAMMEFANRAGELAIDEIDMFIESAVKEMSGALG